jgi:hypothetical protein
MQYVIYDPATGKLTGARIQDLSPEDADHYIEVTDDLIYMSWNNYQANAARDGLEIAPIVQQPASVPQDVRADQFAMAAIDAGVWADIEAHFAGLPDDAAGARARVRFHRSPTVRRNCDLVATVAEALGKTSSDVDALFVAAAALNP